MKTLNVAALAVAAFATVAPAIAFAAEAPQYQGLDPQDFGQAATSQTNWNAVTAPHETAAIRPVVRFQGQQQHNTGSNAYTGLDQRDYGAAAGTAAREGLAD